MLPREAVHWLVQEKYAEAVDMGWIRIVRAPDVRSKDPHKHKMRDLCTFVMAIKTLGAHSVSTMSGPGKVELRRGTEGDEILFRLV